MKTYSLLFVLIFAFVAWQGCAPKTEEASNQSKDSAETAQVKRADETAAKRASIAKARAEKEEQRRLAIVEKARLSPTYRDASGKIVYYKAEVDPSYTGGLDEMRKYLKDNIQYPQEARNQGLEGTVFVDFVVDEKGKVREVFASEVVGDDVDDAFKAESIRVVSAMPGWNAGLQHGKAVDASFSIPITFEMVN
jgi:TonB family protein